MNKRKFLIGADPELFLSKGGVFLSAYGVIPGSKENPYRVNKGAVQVDGMALEFNIDPAESEQQFTDNIIEVMSVLREMVPGYDIEAVPTAHFSKKYLSDQPKEATALGCNPDYNAWLGGARNPKPDDRVLFRTGAGHVHIGWCEKVDPLNSGHFDACITAVKQLDCVLGLGSLLFDEDDTRRTLYGNAGAFRPKPYGVEYRVLSNAWLKSKELMGWVYRSANKAMDMLLGGKALFNERGMFNDVDVQLVINCSNAAWPIRKRQLLAKSFLEQEGFEVP